MTVYLVFDCGPYHDSCSYLQEVFSTAAAAERYIEEQCAQELAKEYPYADLKDRLFVEEREVLD